MLTISRGDAFLVILLYHLDFFHVQSSNPISLKKYLNLKGLLSFGHNLIFKG
jgi:hypothetical protein